MDSTNSIAGSRKGRTSEDSLKAPSIASQPSKAVSSERRLSHVSVTEAADEIDASSTRSSMSGHRSATHTRVHSNEPSQTPPPETTPLPSPTAINIEELHLPPPPDEITDDYGTLSDISQSRIDNHSITTPRTSMSTAPSFHSPTARHPPRKPRNEPTPLTEDETKVAVELLFAVITELYTLSSAWNIRLTLLTAAKTFLLRPGNPSLSSIQTLIQDSLISSQTSDTGIAKNLKKIRENCLPTEDESKTWPNEMTAEEKEQLRRKARKLLCERGMPMALTGVMGQQATAEALGRVFDCLQCEEVARGLVFGLLLQGVRAVTQ